MLAPLHAVFGTKAPQFHITFKLAGDNGDHQSSYYLQAGELFLRSVSGPSEPRLSSDSHAWLRPTTPAVRSRPAPVNANVRRQAIDSRRMQS